MDSTLNCPGNIPYEIAGRINSEIDNLEKSQIGKKLKIALKFNTVISILDSYNEGRRYGNITRMMDRNNYILNEKYTKGLIEDLLLFKEDYFSDSRENSNKNIREINKQISNLPNFIDVLPLISLESLPFLEEETKNLEKFLFDRVKKHETERIMEVTYIDRWIMYNKLFSNKQI